MRLNERRESAPSESFPLASWTWGDEEVTAVRELLDRGKVTMGERVARFEREFADYVGAGYAVMVNSGSSANLLAVATLCFRSKDPLQKGDEVIVPSVAWSTSYFPFQQYGLRLVFVDVDLGTLNYDLGALERAVTDRTRAILAVNMLGNPNDFDVISRIIGDRRIWLVEDNCESLGAEFGGRRAGSFGTLGTHSFYFSHHITTGEGGMVLTDDEELYHLLLCLRSHGWTRHLPDPNHLCEVRSDDPFYESFRFILPGYNVRPMEIAGAIGLEQLKRLPDFVAQRRRNARVFRDLFVDHPSFLIQEEIGRSSWFGFSMIIRPESGRHRDRVVAEMSRNGIDCRPIVAGNFADSEAARWLDFRVFEDLPNARLVHEQGFFVGNHHYEITKELKYLRRVLDDVPCSAADDDHRLLLESRSASTAKTPVSEPNCL